MKSSVHVWRRGLAAAAAVLVIGTGAGGCAGEEKSAARESTSANTGADDGTSQGTSADDGGSQTDGGSPNHDGVEYAACMRKNGIDVPDPAPGESPQLPQGVGRVLLDKAAKECGDPPGSQMAGSGGLADDPKLEALSLANQKCLRENGYKMPDPKEVMTPARPGENPVLDRATEACKKTGDALKEYLKEKVGER